MDCDLGGIVCAVPASVLVLSRFDVDWTGVAQAPNGVRIDGITEVDAAGEVDAQFLAAAFKSAVQAQRVSSDRRSKLEKEFEGKVDAAVEAVAKTKGLTAETAEAIKTQILGVSS